MDQVHLAGDTEGVVAIALGGGGKGEVFVSETKAAPGAPAIFRPERRDRLMADDPIAIVGVACRFPGAPDLDSYERLLFDGVDAVTTIPEDRWAKSYFLDDDPRQPGKSYTFAAGVLDDIAAFDAGFFGVSPREAAHIDPQQRLLLELAYEATEDAGTPLGRLAGSDTGVFIGASSFDYLTQRSGDVSVMDAHSMQGMALSSTANRVSYVFDLQGPSFTVDTACSSSLVALHLACEALRRGEASMALAGGVNLLIAPQAFVGFSRAGMLSPRGRCHAFDARADGYVRSEGGAVVVLKPLAAALADGDPIRGVIKATGVNSDGRTTGLSLPSREGQARLLREVYARAGVEPDDLCYLEAHGTGTPVGDPIEVGAIGDALGRRRSVPLVIGSAKTNIGHLEAASGMAGLLKVLLAFKRGEAPRSLHCVNPNPEIPFDEHNVTVARRPAPLERRGGELVAGVNSFGFGGANAHAVVASPPAVAAEAEAGAPPLLLSARDEDALASLAAEWRARLASAVSPSAVAALLRGAARRRTQHAYRLAAWGDTAEAITSDLDAWLAGEPATALTSGHAVEGRTAFVFSGNGSQWAGMGRGAYAANATFRTAIDEVDALLAPQTGWSAAERLRDGLSPADLTDTVIAQPSLFAVQVGAVQALRAAGVVADAFLGHSVGEVAAAWASGALTLVQACQVVAHRSRLQGRARGVGGMAALGLSAEATLQALGGLSHPLEIAAVNSPTSVTVSGPVAGLVELEALARSRRWLFTRLDLDYAFHSAAMEPIRRDLAEALRLLRSRPARGLLVSSVTGAAHEGQLDADYWWRNVREPVRFAAGIDALCEAGVRLFVEIGPQPILQSYIRESLRQAHVPGRPVASLAKSDPLGLDPFTAVAARCHVAGADITGAAIFDGPAEVTGLPRYPWQRQRHWVERTGEGVELTGFERTHPLLGYRRRSGDTAWFNHLSLARQPWLADHQIDGAAVLPAAALVEMALAAARAVRPDAAVLEVRDLEIARPMLLDGGARETVFSLNGDAFSIESRPRLSAEAMTPHAKGRAGEGAGALPLLTLDRPVGAGRSLGPDAFYAQARRMRLQYGPAFQSVAAATVFESGYVEVAFAPPEPGAEPMLLDPTVLDGALQGLAALQGAGGGDGTAVPWRFGRIRLLRPGVRPATARIQVRVRGPRAVGADLLLLDAHDGVVAELQDCWFVAIDARRGGAERELRFETRLTPTLSQPVRPHVKAPTAAVAPGPAVPASVVLADAFVTAAVQEAVLGVVGADALFAPALLALEGRLARSSLGLFDSMVALLERAGVIERVGEAWRLDPKSTLPASDLIWRSLLEETPEAIGELSLAAMRAGALEAVLREGLEAWPTAPAELRAQMLSSSPSARAALAAVASGVEALVADWPTGRPLRVATVGVIDAATLRRLTVALSAARAVRLTAFVEADGDLGPLAPVLAGLAGATAAPWGERRPASYDLVVGFHPFSGPSGLNAGEVADLLSPGGVLIAAEPGDGGLWPLTAEAPPEAFGAGTSVTAALRAADCPDVGTEPLEGAVWPVVLLTARRTHARPAERLQPGGDRVVRLFAEADDDLATAAAFALAERGRSPASEPIEALGGQPAPVSAEDWVVFAPPPGADGARLALAGAGVAAAVQGLSAGGDHRLWLAGSDRASAAAMEALRRVVANEAPALACRTVALDPALQGGEAVERLLGELRGPTAEAAVVHTPEGRFAPRLRLGRSEVAPVAGPRRLAVTRPGLLSSLAWTPMEPAQPGPDELAIAVRAAGLNFRDVMWAAGLLPDEALLNGFTGPGFGLECAGVVTAVGADVHDLRVGQRVVAVAPAALATHAVTRRHAVLAIPDDVGFEAAATLPVAFLTAVYGLGRLARLERGERVLIHGGAGGVGLAAIQYAQHLGAEVFATAGSRTKREVLGRLGVQHVFDSRDAGFADEVRRATAGEGVDVVLNSLSDELMQQSLRLLRPFGRFVEIGKRDLFDDTAVGLRPLRHNASYFAVDVDQLAALRPAVARQLFDEIEGLLDAGVVRPLPHRVFGFEAVTDAFRLMQGSGHIGKIVLAPEPAGAAVEATAAPAPFVVRADRSYVVTGGLSGFGLEAARWLARAGARRLSLLSRQGPADPAAADVGVEFQAKGVRLAILACDVADRAALAAALETVRADAPIAGVVHAAAVIEDGLLGGLDAERFERVLRPKAVGAANLDALTRADPVDLFVVFSSISTAIGNPGQAPYVVANAVAESVVERRRTEGLPGTAIRWGPIADVGYLERESRVREMLDSVLGGGELTARTALEALPAMIQDGAAVPGLADVDWSVLRRQLPIGASSLFADMPAANALEAGPGALKDRLTGLSEDEARTLILDVLLEETAAILRLPRSRIDVQQPLADIGCDSLMAVELRLAIEARLGGELPLLSVSDGASLDALALRIVRSVRGADDATALLTDQVLRHETAEQAAALTQAAE